MKTIRTIVVDDHKLFRKGLILLLEEIEGVEIIGEASDGMEFIQLIENIQPDLVLMDINMPRIEGDRSCQLALQKYPDLKIIAISMLNDMESFNRMDTAGVKGYLLKNADPCELEKAISAVMASKSYYSQELLLNLVKHDNVPTQYNGNLSGREREVLNFICQGLSNYKIAEKMNLSHRTIDTHRANLLFKTDSKNTVQLVTFAIRNKLVLV